MPAEPRILLVDDTEINLEALEDCLRAERYEMHRAQDGEEAWEILDRDPDFNVVLLDLMMPRLDGMGLLRRMKADHRFRNLPVVLQTADNSPESIAEGIQAGAFYYLTKPLNRKILRSVVRAALDHLDDIHRVVRELEAGIRSAGLLRRAEFSYRSPEDARALASLVVRAYPDPDRVAVGVWEMLINAIEHGNLEITYAMKSQFLQERCMVQEVAHRLDLPAYRDRAVLVTLERSAEAVTLTVEDEGPGFEWEQYLDLAPERAFHTHGRGIAMAKALSFDEIAYQGRGNRVVTKVLLP